MGPKETADIMKTEHISSVNVHTLCHSECDILTKFKKVRPVEHNEAGPRVEG